MEGRPLEDEQLIEKIRAGDVDAYRGLVERYQQDGFRVAYLITKNGAEAQDAVQDAFVKAYGALDRFDPGRSFRAWLLTIAANEARNRVRAAQRRSKLELRFAQDPLSGDAAPSPERAVLATEERDALTSALSKLAEDDRTVIALRYFLELSEKEMAEVLGCAPGTVKSRLSRVKERLRGALIETPGMAGMEGRGTVER